MHNLHFNECSSLLRPWLTKIFFIDVQLFSIAYWPSKSSALQLKHPCPSFYFTNRQASNILCNHFPKPQPRSVVLSNHHLRSTVGKDPKTPPRFINNFRNTLSFHLFRHTQIPLLKSAFVDVLAIPEQVHAPPLRICIYLYFHGIHQPTHLQPINIFHYPHTSSQAGSPPHFSHIVFTEILIRSYHP